MMDAGRHPNIELLTYSEVVDVQGFVGNFDVTVKKRPRYVHLDLCTGCGLCVEACVWKDRVPAEFERGMGMRSAAYIPFAQAVPLKAVIDDQSCLLLTRGKCNKKCQKACERNAIDFEMKEELVTFKVGTVVLATGYELFDGRQLPQYGYGRYDNVLDGIQFERLSSAAGPTGGKIITKDGQTPKAIAILHCIGSRDVNTNPYCSRLCCMHNLKLAHLAREKTDAQVYEFYIDIRAAGKGYEEFYSRVQKDGVHFIRGNAAEITQEDGRLIIHAEDTLLSKPIEVPVDMAVLAFGVVPSRGTAEVSRLFSVSRSADGFFQEAHPKLAPVSTTTNGVFLAGCCQGPKDIPDTVAQASAAAVQAVSLLNRGEVEIEPTTAEVIEVRCSGCGECVLACPFQAIEVEESKAKVNAALCKGCGTCVGTCLAKAIVHHHFTDEELVAEVVGILGDVPMLEFA